MNLSEFPLRFREKVLVDKNNCWIWLGITPQGYGKFLDGGKNQIAHRYSWKFANKQEVPEGLEISHLCHVTQCVNPEHLVAETRQENFNRGRSYDFKMRKYCRSGKHELTPENIYLESGGKQRCYKCHTATKRRAEERKKAKKGEVQ